MRRTLSAKAQANVNQIKARPLVPIHSPRSVGLPTSSWWLNTTRRTFTERAEAGQARMNQSQFGQWLGSNILDE